MTGLDRGRRHLRLALRGVWSGALGAGLLLLCSPGAITASIPATAIAGQVVVDTLPGPMEVRPPSGGSGRTNADGEQVSSEAAPGHASGVPIETEAPPEQGRAAAYARRYGISQGLALQIIDTALREGLDPELGFRLVRVESVFRANARGPAGALGLTQLMPSTARALDRSLRTEAEILDPANNLRTGFRYLRTLIERYGGDVRLGVLAYNRGETAVNRALRAGRDPENGYSSKVLGSAPNQYTGSGLLRR
ncbi:MAG: transglycosylase SLT domain-containing protein [Gemmatimonadota bacterium]